MRVQGYATLWDVADTSGDIFTRGAFSNNLGRQLPMLLQHDPKRRIGTWFRIVEDKEGLWAEGDQTVGTKAIGLSVGFRTLISHRNGYGNRVITLAEIFEISIVKKPMLPKAQLIQRK